MKKILFASCLAAFFLLPGLSLAECTDIGYFDSFTLEGFNTVLLYAGSMAVVRFDVQNCEVRRSSRIQLIRTNMCDGDEIIRDGERCVMVDIKPIGPLNRLVLIQ